MKSATASPNESKAATLTPRPNRQQGKTRFHYA
jgi:hypothetical protein